MKSFKIILLVLFMLSAIPFNGFCLDEGMDHPEQCATACHVICCHSGVILSDTASQVMPDFSSSIVLSVNHTHLSPHIAVEHRPPIVLS